VVNGHGDVCRRYVVHHRQQLETLLSSAVRCHCRSVIALHALAVN